MLQYKIVWNTGYAERSSAMRFNSYEEAAEVLKETLASPVFIILEPLAPEGYVRRPAIYSIEQCEDNAV